jgi:amidohydrolase
VVADDDGSPASLRAAIDGLVEGFERELVATRRHLHAHPELSNREAATAALIADRLRSLGLDEVRTGIAGHGVIGVLRGGRKGSRVVALRADIDALPVRETSGVEFASTAVDDSYPGGPFPVAHACGHDCHTAVVLTTAAVLSEVREQLSGTALFVFQPAEEGPPIGEPGGAQAMLDVGALADPAPTMVFGTHVSPVPKGFVAYRVGTFYAASCLVQIKIRGTQVHGSTPWLGVDPMPAAAAILSGSADLYRQVPATNAVTVSFGHVEDIGRFNIIGESITLWGTIRCVADADMALLQARMQQLAEHTAAAFGCTADVHYHQPVPAVTNTQAWIDATLPTIRRVVGEDHVVPVPPTLGYDDVSVFINTFGGVYLAYGVQDTKVVGDTLVPIEGGRGLVPNHHPAFYADDSVLTGSVRIHANVAVDHLTGVIDVPR